jgi:hypothetical protein
MSIYVGIGGWVFEEWRDNFYPFTATGRRPGKSVQWTDLSGERAERRRGARR